MNSTRCLSIPVLALLTWLIGCAPAPQSRSDVPPEFSPHCLTAHPYARPEQQRSAPEGWLEGRANIEGALDPDTTATLEVALDKIMSVSHTVGVSAAVAIPGRGRWSGVRGLSRLGGTRLITLEDRFAVGSVTKLVTGTLVMQLVQAGRLRLDDSLARWFPQFPNARLITIEQLLSNTSGVNTLGEHPEVLRPGQMPDQVIAAAAQLGNEFCPGSFATYANTNFILLGRILELEYAQTFDQLVTAQLLGPLKLDHTRVLHLGEIPTVSGHRNGKVLADIDYGVPFSAGSLGSTPTDLVRLLHALLSGEVLDTTHLLEMASVFRPLEGFDAGTLYGKALMLRDSPLGALVWHGGSIDGFRTFVGYAVKLRVFVAVTFNDELPAEAGAFLLLSALEKVAH